MPLHHHPYAAFLHKVAKPARYTGGEYNQIVKDPASVRASMVLGFPDIYDIGMSHLGTKILYSLLNKHSEILAERAFCPWLDMEKELRERTLPLLTLESARPLADFDVVGFSLQYELTYTNILTMLDLSDIPLRAADREEHHPLVIAGGPCATQPEPIAPMIDAFLIGDAEEKLPEMLLLVADLKKAGKKRREILVEVAKLGGFYCPALYDTEIDPRTGFLVVGAPNEPGVPEKTERQIVEDLSRYPFPDDAPVAAAEAIFDRMAIEIARGCTEGCRFCQAGMIYRPVRERDPEEIVETIVSAVEKGGYDEVGLTTLSTADYSCISPLIKKVMEKLRVRNTSLSVASLRAYGLDEDLLDEIRTVRATGLTFAPEAGTQRMRDVVNKNITEEDLERTADRVFSRGWRRMKLYFMIGLPTETDEDVVGIMETGRRMKEIGVRYHNRGRVGVTVSVSSHVPKPHTPFQWCALDSLDEIERKQDLLKFLAGKYRLEFRRHEPRTSYLECVLGRGDRRMADVIETAWRAGARFDSWDEQLKWDNWVAAMQTHDAIPYELYLGTLPTDARLPWDHLDMKLEPRFLVNEYRRTLKNKLSPPCGKPVGAQVHHTNLLDHEEDQRILVCYNCGVACDMTRMREERGEFLENLGAFSKRPKEVESVVAARSNGNGVRPGKEADPGDRHRYRVHFAKTGVAALTGHLDLVRALPRIVRRAGITAFYSRGFHPKPVMEFSPPLPLGVDGLEEVVDLSLSQEYEAGDVLERLQAFASDGMTFKKVQKLGSQDPKLNRVLSGAEYVVRLEKSMLEKLSLCTEDLDRAPVRFLERETATMDVFRKRKPKRVDIRPAVEEVRWMEPAELPEEIPAKTGERHLFVRLRFLSESHARPEEVAEAVLGSNPGLETTHLTRVCLLGKDRSGSLIPLDPGVATAVRLAGLPG